MPIKIAQETFWRKKVFARAHAKKIILKFQIAFATKQSNFFENSNADIFGARTQNLSKI